MKPQENPNFLKNGKMVISVKIRNFSRSRMTKRTSSLESFRKIKLPGRIPRQSEFHVFRGNGCSAGHLAYFKWLTVCHMSSVDLVKQGELLRSYSYAEFIPKRRN